MDATEDEKSMDVTSLNICISTNGYDSATPNRKHGHGHTVDAKSQSLEEEKADAWHKQSQPYKLPQPSRKGKQKNDSITAAVCQWIVDHQIGKDSALRNAIPS